jgi:hypothetical protein
VDITAPFILGGIIMSQVVLVPNISREFPNIKPDNSCMRCHKSRNPYQDPEADVKDVANMSPGLLLLRSLKDVRVRREAGKLSWFTRDKTVSVVHDSTAGEKVVKFKGRLPNKGSFAGAIEIPLHRGAAGEYDYLEFLIAGRGTIQTQFYYDGNGDGIRKYPSQGWGVQGDDAIVRFNYSSNSGKYSKVRISLSDLSAKRTKNEILVIQFNAHSFIQDGEGARHLTMVDLLVKGIKLLRKGKPIA